MVCWSHGGPCEDGGGFENYCSLGILQLLHGGVGVVHQLLEPLTAAEPFIDGSLGLLAEVNDVIYFGKALEAGAECFAASSAKRLAGYFSRPSAAGGCCITEQFRARPAGSRRNEDERARGVPRARSPPIRSRRLLLVAEFGEGAD